MRQAVLRKTLTGDWTEFAFAKKGRFYFVKNFTDSDIFVSFENGTAEENSIKIKSNSGEEVSISYDAIDRDIYYADKIYVKGTGEVEVQSIDIYSEVLDVQGNVLNVGEDNTIENNTLEINSENTEVEENTLNIL